MPSPSDLQPSLFSLAEFTRRSRFLLPGKELPAHTLPEGLEFIDSYQVNAFEYGITCAWLGDGNFSGGSIEFGLPRNQTFLIMQESSPAIVVNFKIKKPGHRLNDGTKEGLVVFFTMLATIEAWAQRVTSNPQLGWESVYHVERATQASLPLFMHQVELGNYTSITKDQAGAQNNYAGYFWGRYPKSDSGLQAFILQPAVDWLVQRTPARKV